jgi:hypothetical protein
MLLMRKNSKSNPITGFVLIYALSNSFLAMAQSQTPPVIKQQLDGLQDRFQAVLEEECPSTQCFPVGCKVQRFDTLDRVETSSLPGLDAEPPAAAPQYKLAAVICEFTHEASLQGQALDNLRQRIRQKVKPVGIELQLMSRALEPKAIPVLGEAQTPAEAPLPPKPIDQVFQAMLPFIPWILLLLVVTAVFLLTTWFWRQVGRQDPTGEVVEGDKAETHSKLPEASLAEPTFQMLIQRREQLQQELRNDERLVASCLHRLKDQGKVDEICYFIKYFGPEILEPLKVQPEFQELLQEISKKYAEFDFVDDWRQTWVHLDLFERYLTAAKVHIDDVRLADEFKFLSEAGVDEFIGILAELQEPEAIAAVAYAPKSLREAFFAKANASFAARFVEQLTRMDKMPDSLVRTAASKLKRAYAEKGASFRTIAVDRVPLLEDALNALDGDGRKAIMRDMRRGDRKLAEEISSQLFFDDSLPLFPDTVLTELFLSITPEEAASYLSSHSWGSEILGRLNPKIAQGIKSRWSGVPNAGNRVSSQTREKISRFVKTLHAKGTIHLGRLNLTLMAEAHEGK